MKTMLILSTLALIGAVCCSSCKETSTAQETVLLIDLTDSFCNQFDTTDINSISIVDDSKWNGETTKVVTISDVGVNKQYVASIPRVPNKLYGNDSKRKEVVASYFLKINYIIASVLQEKRGRDESVIYKRIAEELNILADKNVGKKTLIINSDLMEKSFINFYKPSVLSEIVSKPDVVAKKIIDKYPLSRLDGIEIYILYQPVSIEDNARFEIVSTFYKNLFESHGAVVHIQSNI